MKDEDLEKLKDIENDNLDKKNISDILTLYKLKKDIDSIIDSIEMDMSPDNKEIIDNFKEVFDDNNKSKIHYKIEEFNSLEEDKKAEKIKKIKSKINTFQDNVEKINNFTEDNQNVTDNNSSSPFDFLKRVGDAFSKDVNIDPSRLLALTDGIFGMVITLLAFGIALPEITITNSASFLSFLTELLPNIGVVIVSFVLVSTFWIYHHEFLKIKTLNFPFLWLNVLYLASISFIPFTTSLIGTYSRFFHANLMFGLNIFVTILSFLLLHAYAVKKDLLETKISKAEKKYRLKTFLFMMALTVIVNLLDYHISPNFIYLFLLVPIISTFRDIKINK